MRKKTTGLGLTVKAAAIRKYFKMSGQSMRPGNRGFMRISRHDLEEHMSRSYHRPEHVVFLRELQHQYVLLKLEQYLQAQEDLLWGDTVNADDPLIAFDRRFMN